MQHLQNDEDEAALNSRDVERIATATKVVPLRVALSLCCSRT